jgi:hypothetical protein
VATKKMSKEEKAVRDALAQLEKDAAVSDTAVTRMNQSTSAPVSTYEEARSRLSEIKDPKIRAAFEKSFTGIDASTERLKTQAAGLGLQVDPNTGSFVPAKQQQQEQKLTPEQYLAQQEAKLAAEAALQNRKSAYDLLLEQFNQYGLGSLVEGIKGLVQENVSPSEFAIRLRQTDAYKKRFAANASRITNGLRALSEGEYIELEDQYQNVMRNYGLPASYYTKGTAGRQEGFEKLIAGDVSDVELEERIVNAQKRVIDADPNIKEALKQFYPDIKDGEILAYVLDPDKGLADIKKKITAAEIGGAALSSKLVTTMSRAEELARYGVTAESARAGFGAIGGGLERGSQLVNIYQQQPYTQALAEEEVFNLPGQTDAQRKRKKIIGLEQAEFAGQTGVTSGALGRERAGSF